MPGVQQIIIEFDDNYDLKIETSGFDGDVCLKDSEWIRKALGSQTSNMRKKIECFKPVKKQKAYLNNKGSK